MIKMDENDKKVRKEKGYNGQLRIKTQQNYEDRNICKDPTTFVYKECYHDKEVVN